MVIPLVPYYFVLLYIDPFVMHLTSTFKVFYMDDGTIGGTLNEVLEDFKIVEPFAPMLGLQLNQSKCEVHCSNFSSTELC